MKCKHKKKRLIGLFANCKPKYYCLDCQGVFLDKDIVKGKGSIAQDYQQTQQTDHKTLINPSAYEF